VDTLAALRRERPDDALFVLVGADSFLGLSRWREPERLLALAEWIVVSRPGFSLAPQALPGGRVHLLESVHEDVSATELRRRLRDGEECAELVPEAVLGYIREHRLYGQQ
jgi:nicotinate-nucleotide adenylyltransferase